MKKHLPIIIRATGFSLISCVVAASAYSYYSAKSLMSRLHDWKPNTDQAEASGIAFPLGSGVDLHLHDTYYVVASPTFITTGLAALASGLFLIAFPNLIIRPLRNHK